MYGFDVIHGKYEPKLMLFHGGTQKISVKPPERFMSLVLGILILNL